MDLQFSPSPLSISLSSKCGGSFHDLRRSCALICCSSHFVDRKSEIKGNLTRNCSDLVLSVTPFIQFVNLHTLLCQHFNHFMLDWKLVFCVFPRLSCQPACVVEGTRGSASRIHTIECAEWLKFIPLSAGLYTWFA